MAKIEEIVIVVGQDASDNTSDSSSSTTYANKDLSNVADTNILEKLKSVDGGDSGLDADTVDGKHAADFALLNGDADQRFKVADAVEDDEAVNKKQSLELIENYISQNDLPTTTENALKFNGYKLLASINEDGSFNNDGVFKIKEVNGAKTLFGILDIYTEIRSTAIFFDIFGDSSCVALYEFENNANDTGGAYNGVPTEGITYTTGKISYAVQSSGSYQVKINNLPFTSDTDIVTISAWVEWNGNNAVKAFGWHKYNIYFYSGGVGFNTYNSDVYGVPNDEFRNTWKHLVVEFRKGEYGKIWVDGEPRSLSQICGSIDTSNAVVGSEFHVFGWGHDSGYRNFGCVDNLRIFNRALTDAEVQKIYKEGA